MRKISFLEGVPSQTIYDMYADQQGFLYIGTDKGMYRFNGSEFKRINQTKNVTKSINNICQNKEGVIWCKNFSNQVFFVENDTLKQNQILQQYIDKSGNLREMIMVDNTLWLLTMYEVFTFNTLTEKLQNIQYLDKSKQDNFFMDVYFEPIHNKVYFSDMNYIYSYSNQTSIEYTISNIQNTLMSFKGDLFYTSKNTEKFTQNVSKNEQYTFPHEFEDSYFNYLRTTKNHLWLCTNKGLLQVKKNIDLESNYLLQNRRISDVIEDFCGNIWISTLDEGLFIIPNIELKTYSLPLKLSFGEQISYLPIIKGPNKTLFIGTSLGQIFWLNENGKTIKTFDTGLNNEIEFLYYDSVYNRLLHTFGMIDINTQQENNTIGFGKWVYPDDDNNYIVCSYALSGLIPRDLKSKVNFNVENNTLTKSIYSKLAIDLLSFREVRSRVAFYDTTYKKYYVSYSDGLYVYDKFGQQKIINTNNGEPIIATDFQLDNNGNLWVSSINKGLFKIKDTTILENITTSVGLSSDECKKITIDNSILWVINDLGIDRINLTTKEISKFTKGLGLNQMAINDLIIQNNLLWITTNNGVLSLPINQSKIAVKPRLYKTVTTVNGNIASHLEYLSYDENNVNIGFESVHFNSLEKHEFRYRLLGYDSVWNYYSGNLESFNYISLPPGKYTFQIQAISNADYSEMQEVHFTINNPFWLTWWFILIVILISLSILYWVYLIAENRTKRKQLIREKLALSQLTALRAQMNPHFLFNVLNSVQGLIYSNQKNDATEYLGKFSDLMRKTLEISGRKVISLDEEIEMISIYLELEKARFDDGIEIIQNIDPLINLNETKIPSMIIQPFIENAIKHGLMHQKGRKKLTISILLNQKHPDHILIEIDDNGIGRNASHELNKNRKKHHSFATQAINSRINLLNQALTKPIIIECIDKMNEQNEPTGTKVKIFMPNNLN